MAKIWKKFWLKPIALLVYQSTSKGNDKKYPLQKLNSEISPDTRPFTT